MAKQVRVSDLLVDRFEETRREIAQDLKKRYGLEEIRIPENFVSDVIAHKLGNKKKVNFKICKTSPKKGYVQLI